ncbi:hypothetical protein GGX14DRAFT_403117 [Mycena pura]|uniref:Uncharacterized protein n=1 Tax=Mycena pura TaxID=153505 RepID=A0AAD6Y1G2_9AGAR|nr:hypothetical protein GGX14DRAFT_403117 [Mycena pura]
MVLERYQASAIMNCHTVICQCCRRSPRTPVGLFALPFISPRFRCYAGQGAGRQPVIVPLLLAWRWSRIVDPTRFAAMVLRRIAARDGDCGLVSVSNAKSVTAGPYSAVINILPAGEKAFPSWASSMASATPEPTSFDLAAASAFVLGPSPTPTPDQPAKTSSVSTPISTTTSTTSQQAQLSAHRQAKCYMPSRCCPLTLACRNSFPAGAVAGIVVGICLMVSVAVFIYLRLRRHRRRQPEAAGDISPISPYTADPSTPGAWDAEAKFGAARRTTPPEPHSSTTSFPDAPSVQSNASPASEAPLVPIRRRDPHHESRTVQQKTDLVEEWLSSTSLAHPGPAGRNVRALSTVSAWNAGADAAPADPDPDVVLQLRAMTARVRELEAQVESPPQVYAWPGTPPPGYSGAGRASTRAFRAICKYALSALPGATFGDGGVHGAMTRDRFITELISAPGAAGRGPTLAQLLKLSDAECVVIAANKKDIGKELGAEKLVVSRARLQARAQAEPGCGQPEPDGGPGLGFIRARARA